jgi:hypothetical protein
VYAQFIFFVLCNDHFFSIRWSDNNRPCYDVHRTGKFSLSVRHKLEDGLFHLLLVL